MEIDLIYSLEVLSTNALDHGEMPRAQCTSRIWCASSTLYSNMIVTNCMLLAALVFQILTIATIQLMNN